MNADPGVYLTQHQYIEDPQTIVKLMTQKTNGDGRSLDFLFRNYTN